MGKVYIIDEIMFCRVSESLVFPGLLSSQYFTVKGAQERLSSMIPRYSNSGRIDCRNGFYFCPSHLCHPFVHFSGNGGQPLLRGQVIPQDLSAGIEVCQDLQKAL